VEDPGSFWKLLSNGVDTVTEVPPERFDLERVYDPRKGIPGKMYARFGAFLPSVDLFDAAFFGISPREALHLDPQQRLLLEVSWEALEDAGLSQERMPRSRTGVFLGMMANDYMELMHRAPASLDLHSLNGGGRYGASGRISFCLGLEGPSLTLDTACSSSLVTLHLACQSLQSGECDLALAGGAHLVLQPHDSIAICQGGLLSMDGHCKFGDARADGFVRGEGVAMVALKRLSEAIADGDRIYAMVRGTAVNSDGASNLAMSTPSTVTQVAMLREAYRRAGIAPGRVRYIEAHGTGTSVGDRVELEALAGVLAEEREPDFKCFVGSVKTNIGHTEAASGIAGLIKLALCLYHREIPRSLHCHDLNPAVPWSEIPLVVQRGEKVPWPDDPFPAIGGVNSFGLSGTNAHAVLEEPPRRAWAQGESPAAGGPWLVPITARRTEALRALVMAWQERLARPDAPPVADLAWTAALRRTHLEYRAAVVAGSPEELREGLQALLDEEPRPGVALGHAVAESRPRIAFVFPGNGWQWQGMGRELLATEPVFRMALEECSRVIERETGWSPIDRLLDESEASRFGEIPVIQPVLFALQVALAALWRSWGVRPDAVVGHSLGEVAAAHVAGILTLEDAVRIACRRSSLLQRAAGRGETALVELTLDEAESALGGSEDRVWVAGSNSSRSTLLSGDPTALAEVLARLESRGVFCRRIQMGFAAHCPQMDPVCDDLREALREIAPRPAEIPLISTVDVRAVEGAELNAGYWVRNLRLPVRFSSAIDLLVAAGDSVFVEMSAHPVLLPAVEQELRHLGRSGRMLPSLRRQKGERATLLGSLADLWAGGTPVDWSALHPSGGRSVDLPRYAWQRERFWLDLPPGAVEGWSGGAWRGGSHPLLGLRLDSSADPGTHYWEADLSLDALPYLADHRVRGMILVPGAAFLEMALSAALEAFSPDTCEIESARFLEALLMPQDGVRTVQTVLTSEGPGRVAFRISSLQEDGGRERSWTLHARGLIRLSTEAPEASEREAPPEELSAGYSDVLPGAEAYARLASRGLEYGAAFQGIEQAWFRPGEALAFLRLRPEALSGPRGYQVHPAMLDTAFQLSLVAAGLGERGAGETFLPIGLERLRLSRPLRPSARVWAHAKLRPESSARELRVDIFLLDGSGERLLEAQGLVARRIGRTADEEIETWFHGIRWRRESGTVSDVGVRPGRWLLLTGGDGIGRELAERLQERGEECLLATPGEGFAEEAPGRYRLDPSRREDVAALFAEVLRGGVPCRGVVHLWGLDAAVPDAVDRDPAALPSAVLSACEGLLHLVQGLAEASLPGPPALTVVTRGVHRLEGGRGAVSCAQAPLWGLGAVIAAEHPSLRCTLVDLEATPDLGEAHALAAEITAADAERRICLRDGLRYVARLASGVPDSPAPQIEPEHRAGQAQGFQVELVRPHDPDSVQWRRVPRALPGAGEVEVEVAAVALDPRDLERVEGRVPGIEIAGRITAIGEGVEGLVPGQEVLGFARGALSRFVVADARLLAAKPATLEPGPAAALPRLLCSGLLSLAEAGAPWWHPDAVGSMLRAALSPWEGARLAAPPVRSFPVAQVREALRAAAGPSGEARAVVLLTGEPPPEAAVLSLHPDATYLLTGGLGGLGLEVARWLAEQGARHLVLVGRRAPSEEARACIDRLEAMGARVYVASADVARHGELAALLEELRSTLPPLRGVFHAAGLLDDGILAQQSRERFERVMAPKMAGAWNLHLLTRGLPLDFFVLFSSISTVLGTAGQGNYAAANAFLDALAQERARCGQPALSVSWGAWAEVGLAAAHADRGERFAGRGLASMPPALGVRALERLMARRAVQAVVSPFDAAAWCASEPAAAGSPLFSELLPQGGEPGAAAEAEKDLAGSLRAAAPDLRHELLEVHLSGRIGQVLKLAPEQVDRGFPLRMMGFDSLMTMELRNRLEVDLGVSLSAAALWNYPSVTQLAAHLTEQVAPAEPPAPTPVPGPVKLASQEASLAGIVADVSTLSDDDALEALLGGGTGG
jgi:acyl transferase domain-containing protein/NAD(P)-dependent dehydrogenase (short-subunit alcohol dehydrogenase family)/acyl carrier protein